MPDAGLGPVDTLPHVTPKPLLRAAPSNGPRLTDEETGPERVSYQGRLHSSGLAELDLTQALWLHILISGGTGRA